MQIRIHRYQIFYMHHHDKQSTVSIGDGQLDFSSNFARGWTWRAYICKNKYNYIFPTQIKRVFVIQCDVTIREQSSECIQGDGIKQEKLERADWTN